MGHTTDDYAKRYAEFSWQLPETFNFGRDVIDAWAARRPDATALIWCDESGREARFTFAEMRRMSDQCANLLSTNGVRRGDRVIVMLPRIPQWQVAMLGCVKLGAIPIPCIEMLTAKDIRYRVEHSGASAAIATAASVGKFDGLDGVSAKLVVGGAQGWVDFDAALRAAPERFDAPAMGLEEPAILYYTSGSTGMPKGVTHAVRALYSWRVSAIYWHGLGTHDLMWCTADTGWSKAGTSILFGPWSCGSAVLFYDGRFDPAQRLALIEKYGVTVFCGAATEFRHILELDIDPARLRRLRTAVSAGESVNPEVVRRWTEKTGLPLIEAYGQTETLMTVSNYPSSPVKPGSMGRPLPGCRLAVLDEAGVPVPAGEKGQLALELPNPQLMLGYWNDPERTASTRVEHGGQSYFLTGDMAWIDADGYIHYAGRADDIISSAGYRIGPMEVENALIEHPAVVECAVVGSPDEERGEIVKAFVVLRPNAKGDDTLVRELQEHVRRVTAPYKYPRAIEFVAQIPKTVSGKLLRRVLRDQEYAANSNRAPG